MNPEGVPSAGKRNPLLLGFVFGLFILFLLQIVLGIVLELRYHASAPTAYQDVLSMQSGGLGRVRAFHYWSSAFLIVGSFTTLVWMLFARWFNGGHSRLWLSTALLFLVSLLSQISGNLLPFDRHGVQTAVIESGVARQMPVVGPATTSAILGGDRFNTETIARWHLAHVSIFVLGLVAAGLALNAAKGEERNKMALAAPAVAVAILGVAANAPLGLVATQADFGSYEAQVSWYTWPLHGSLHLFSQISSGLGWIGAGVIPGLFAAFIVLAPLAARRYSYRLVQTAFLAFCAYFLIAGIFFGGQFAPLVGNRDPALARAPVSTTVMPPVNRALYSQGRDFFNSEACAGCHGKDGQHGTEGPDLLGVAARHGVDPTWYESFIKDPKKLRPNTTMPGFPEFSAEKTRALAEFLIHQKP
jgi:quinol-cytochrome oxidoreductase complex cytochrome b subunit